MIVSIVRFRSGLGDADVQSTFEARSTQYAKVPGLIEKLYLRFRDSGDYGAVYVWDSNESLERFHHSELGRTIASAYKVDGAPDSELADVRLVVRPASATPIERPR